MNTERGQEIVITMERHNPVGSSFIVGHVPWVLLRQRLFSGMVFILRGLRD